jgi:ribosomal protein S18 acetylase RimI-like enzyme
MPDLEAAARVRPLDELDIGSIVRIDERITGIYRPDIWEQRVGYYLRRDPESSRVAEVDGRVVGFMLGDVRAGEFGLEEPSGWIERFGIDPDYRGRDLGKRLFEAIVEHFRARGARVVRTLVDHQDAGVAGFLGAVGFAPSPLRALELRLAPDGREPTLETR